ncbi:MAG: hypothetical protein ACK5UX_00675, partial [Burkholderiales bacterium]
MHWDLYNYHLYAPHAALSIPLDQDFMGAGWLRYINPYAAMPFYWMVVSNWPAMLISVVLACVHALNISLVWWISRAYLFRDFNSRDLSAIATALGAATTVFLGLVGSTFTDPLTSILLLVALAALMESANKGGRTIWTLIAGFAAGVACGLKLTNAVLAAALCISALAIGTHVRGRLRNLCLF